MLRRIPVGTVDDPPYALVVDRDDNVWASMVTSGRLARIDGSHAVEVADLGAPESRPTLLAVAPDGALWCTRYGDNRLQVLSAGGHRTIELPPGTEPYGVAVTPDGAVWFTGFGSESLGRVEDDGQVTTIPLAEPGRPAMITAGADGGLWFTLNRLGAVGRLDPATGAVLTYPLGDPAGGPVGIAAGPDGVWCVQILAGRVAQLSYDGARREVDLPDRGARPHAVAATDDGGCWVTLWGGSDLVRVDADGTVTPSGALRPDDHPHGVVVRGEEVWAALDSGDVGVLTP